MKSVPKIFSQAHSREYPRGQILLYQGEQIRDIFYIESGYVKVYDITSQSTEKLLMILGPGDIFPLLWKYDEVGYLHYFYEAFSDVKMGVIPKQDFVDALNNDFEFTKELLTYSVNVSQELMSRVECIELTSAKHKVGQVLLYLSRSHGTKKGKWDVIEIPITHQSIADMAGITRETTSLHLKDLENHKVFTSDTNGLKINSEKLVELLNA